MNGMKTNKEFYKSNILFISIIVVFFASCNIASTDTKDDIDCSMNCSVVNIKADSLYNQGDLDGAVKLYKESYDSCNDYTLALKIAQIYALLYNHDSALFFLDYATKCDSSIDNLYLGEFFIYQSFPEFKVLEQRQLNKYEVKNGKLINRNLTKELLRLKAKDQSYYSHQRFYPDSLDYYWDIKTELNKQNLLRIEEIIDQYGWPKKSEVGPEASSAAYLILQHCGDAELMKKYLPILKTLLDQEEAEARHYARMVDRINMFEGKQQIYGTQILRDKETHKFYLTNVYEPENINKRRLEIGLSPIEDYLQKWDAEFRK